MYWQGKIIGAIVGALIGRLAGAIVGALIGHVFDLRAQRNAAGAQRARAADTRDTEALRDACTLLGIETGASDDEVQTAYRRQMSRYHPDKLAPNGAPEPMIELAKERTQRIREAYETIRAHRGLK